MENEGCSRVVGMGTMELNFSYGKKATLMNVLHVLDMNMNIGSEDLLIK